MSYTLTMIFSFSIAIAAIIGLVRFKKIGPAYYPFIYCLWIGLLAEVLSTILAYTIGNNQVVINIYLLVESFLLTWLFKNWGLFDRRKYIFWIVLVFLLGVWATQMFIISRIDAVAFYFMIIASFVITLMSISAMNSVIVRERKNILQSPVFLICSAFILYFTLRVVVYTSWLYGESISYSFRYFVAASMVYVNLLANLIYALAVLWMPARQRFSMPS